MESRLIIGTSGHIDHGKTSLVKALCGVDLDSAPEEKERGITISLGFTDLILSGQRRVSFIDVPGHERLVRTMISGAMGMDAVLLCVSAVDGVMPQTREHFAILRLLNIRHGIIALTMSDLVDEEMLELAQLDVEELVEGSFLENAPIIQTAVGENLRGIDTLKDAIENLPAQNHRNDGPFRLPIDRIFIQKGFGAVITGTTQSGRVSVGEEIDILPGSLSAKIRGIQHHGHPVEAGKAGQRIAMNLSGLKPELLQRGLVICSKNEVPTSNIIDVEYEHLSHAPSIKDGTRVRLLSGSTERLARMSILSDADMLEEGRYFLQLRTESPMVLLPQDRFILQRESPVVTLGGGHVLDPWSRRTRKRNRNQAVEQLAQIAAGNRSLLLARRKQEGASAACVKLWNTPSVQLGDQHYAPLIVDELRESMANHLQDWHRIHPLKKGIRAQELLHIHPTPLPPRAYQDLIKVSLERGTLVQHEKGLYAQPGFNVTLTREQDEECQRLIARIEQHQFEGAPLQHFRENPLIAFLIDAERVYLIQAQLVCASQIDIITEKLNCFFTKNETLEPNDFKEMTGLSRKYAIPMLEWFDLRGYTIRQGNRRKRR